MTLKGKFSIGQVRQAARGFTLVEVMVVLVIAALMMALGAEAVFVGSGVFKSKDPEGTAEKIVRAVTHWEDAEELARIMEDFTSPMKGLEMTEIPAGERLQERGW